MNLIGFAMCAQTDPPEHSSHMRWHRLTSDAIVLWAFTIALVIIGRESLDDVGSLHIVRDGPLSPHMLNDEQNNSCLRSTDGILLSTSTTLV